MFSQLVYCVALAATAAAPDTLVYPMKEVIVSSSRVQESALRAPAAVTVVGKGSFANTRNIGLADALQQVPGVLAQSRAGGQDVRITIRGYGARGSGERSNVGNIRGIRVMTDGIPVTEPDGRTSLDLVDLGTTDHIEVVRSNASVLYGNASGGVVNLRSHLGFDHSFAKFTQDAGSYGFHREQGVAGFTMGRARGTVTLFNSTYEGWRAHSRSAATTAGVRMTVPLEDGTRLGLIADATSNFNLYPGGLTPAQFAADPSQANAKFVTNNERRRNRVGRVAATLDRPGEAGQALSAALWVEPKMLQRSERGKFKEFNRYNVGGSAVWSREFKLASGMTTRTTVGGDEAFQDGAIQFTTLGAGGSRTNTITDNKREGANSAGVFAQQSFTNGPWTAQLAARYDNLWYLSQDNLDSTLTASKRFTRVTPKATASYRLANQTIYASLGGGVESPAFNEIDPPSTVTAHTPFNPFLEPMVSATYEVGMRGRYRGEWSYDAALYWIDVTNDIIPYSDGRYFFTAGKSRRRGAELQLDWQPLAALSLGGTVSASENTYVDYARTTANGASASEAGVFDDNDVAGLPSLVFGARGRYRFPVGITTELALNGNGKYFADDRNSIEIMPYGVLNATLAYDHELPQGSLRAFVSGNNLIDKKYAASAFINPLISGGQPQVIEPGLPRNFNAGLTLRWK
jgi:iron complex outermembrane receptor protein